MTDTTEFSLFGQKMYLSPALDSHNSYLVGYTLSDQSALDMAPPMLEKAHTSIPDEIELIFHSNQGWQCPRKQYFGPLKSELLYLPKFRFPEHFELEFVDHPGY